MNLEKKFVDINSIDNFQLQTLISIFKDYQLYLVGGIVRDLLNNNISKDYDLTTNASVEEMIKLAKEHSVSIIINGIDFGCVIFIISDIRFEITTFRIESDYYNHRYPKHISFVDSIKDDLIRRDFTINAMAIDLKNNNQLIDYYNGYSDLAKRVIKTVINPFESFNKDYLRILRALRFSYILNFTFENNTNEALSLLYNNILEIPKPKIKQELEKIFLSRSNYSIKILKRLFILLFPKLNDIDLDHNLNNVDLCSKVVLEDDNYLLMKFRYLFDNLSQQVSIDYLTNYQFSKNMIKKMKILTSTSFTNVELIKITHNYSDEFLEVFNIFFNYNLLPYKEFHLEYYMADLITSKINNNINIQLIFEDIIDKIFANELKNCFKDIDNYIKNIYF